MEKTTTKYVLQRADGQFYYKGRVSSSWGFTEDFNKAYLFDTEKGAKLRQSLPAAGKDAVIRPVIIGLPRTINIPTVWLEEDIKKSPSEMSAASYDIETGEFSSYTKYYDGDGNEITEEEYRALVRQSQD
jgi:hypothetical protein